jgi:hypothetical protein
MSNPGPSESNQLRVKKQPARKKKSEAEKLAPFSWDSRIRIHPCNTDKLGVPKYLNDNQPYRVSDESSGEEGMQIDGYPQSPINQIPAGFADPLLANESSDAYPSDIDDEHHKLVAEKEERKRQERLKRKEAKERQKSKSPSSTQSGGVAKKKKQVPTAPADGAGPSNLITPAPGAGAPPRVAPSAQKAPKIRSSKAARKSVNPRKLPAPLMETRETTIAAPDAPISAAPADAPISAAPTASETNKSGTLTAAVLKHVVPLSSAMKTGTVAHYMAKFIKLAPQQQQQHADIISSLAEVSTEELKNFILYQE